jgi:hypothetical protein
LLSEVAGAGEEFLGALRNQRAAVFEYLHICWNQANPLPGVKIDLYGKYPQF